MTDSEAKAAVRAYVENAWPVSSLNADSCWRKAWAESHLPNIGLNLFRELVLKEGYSPRQFGGPEGPYIMRLPGPSRKLADGFLKYEGM